MIVKQDSDVYALKITWIYVNELKNDQVWNENIKYTQKNEFYLWIEDNLEYDLHDWIVFIFLFFITNWRKN